MKLSKHQRRVLTALVLLEQKHRWSWYSRESIGRVVAAGGYHQTLQVATVRALKRAGLIQTQRSSWAEVTRQSVRCGCGCCSWGLTDEGRRVAAGFMVQVDEATWKRIESLSYEGRPAPPDEDEWDCSGGGDDDDDDGPEPCPPAPVAPSGYCHV